MSTSTQSEPFTYEDGYVQFHPDGSTTLSITIPAGRGGTGEVQYDRLVKRLLQLALNWSKSEDEPYYDEGAGDG
jgi:hypothetical protein